MVTEGLSLNASKTRIGLRSELESGARHRLQDVFSSSEMESMANFIQMNYGGGDDDSEDDTLNNPFIEFLEPSTLFEKMDSLGDKKRVDLSIFKLFFEFYALFRCMTLCIFLVATPNYFTIFLENFA